MFRGAFFALSFLGAISLAHAAAVNDANPVINNGAGVVVGAPTGGNLGPGTINTTGVYVNGQAVGGGLAVPNACVIGGTGTALNGVTLGTNLSCNAGTLNATGATPGGTSGQIQTNNAGQFGGIATGTTGASTVLQTNSGGTVDPSVLPTATVSQAGVVRPDNSTITISNGVLSGKSGTVTSASVATANGFSGTVANAATTPQITITLPVTGLLKGNGTAVSAATAGTDYVAPTGSGAALTGLTFGQIGSTPTTLNGYGITNGLVTSNNLSDLASATTARTNLGLGTMATQGAGAVAITGGTIAGADTTSTVVTPTGGTPMTLGAALANTFPINGGTILGPMNTSRPNLVYPTGGTILPVNDLDNAVLENATSATGDILEGFFFHTTYNGNGNVVDHSTGVHVRFDNEMGSTAYPSGQIAGTLYPFEAHLFNDGKLNSVNGYLASMTNNATGTITGSIVGFNAWPANLNSASGAVVQWVGFRCTNWNVVPTGISNGNYCLRNPDPSQMIDTNGAVAIGRSTISAAAMLDVQGVTSVASTDAMMVRDPSGAQILSVLNNDFVGINTVNPQAALEITGTNAGAGTKAFLVQNSASTALFTINNDGSMVVGATAAVTCATGSPTSSFATANGIVTHC